MKTFNSKSCSLFQTSLFETQFHMQSLSMAVVSGDASISSYNSSNLVAEERKLATPYLLTQSRHVNEVQE